MSVKFYWDTSIPTCFCVVLVCFHVIQVCLCVIPVYISVLSWYVCVPSQYASMLSRHVSMLSRYVSVSSRFMCGCTCAAGHSGEAVTRLTKTRAFASWPSQSEPASLRANSVVSPETGAPAVSNFVVCALGFVQESVFFLVGRFINSLNRAFPQVVVLCPCLPELLRSTTSTAIGTLEKGSRHWVFTWPLVLVFLR